jgi:hypothetical protein
VANTTVSVNLFDTDGKLLYQNKVQVVKGLNTIPLPSAGFNSSGLKVVQVIMQAEKLNYRFISN